MTKYVVFRRDNPGAGWKRVDIVEAHSAEHAIRTVFNQHQVSTVDASRWAACAERSWVEKTVELQVQERLVFSDGTPVAAVPEAPAA